MKERDLSIDALRFIGLALIVLVHVNPPIWIAQFRAFDVPLMVFVSGLAIAVKQTPSYMRYLWNRSKRLLIPVWLFLLIYLSTFYCLQSLFLPEPYLNCEMVLRSFLLLDKSIGYVWIIRVFLLIMLLPPPICSKICTKLSRLRIFFITIICLVIFQETICLKYSKCQPNDSAFSFFIEQYLLYFIGYIPLLLLGVRLRFSDSKERYLYILGFLLILCVYLISKYDVDGAINITGSKYPPHGIYTIYGLLASTILWSSRKFLNKLSIFRPIIFIGQNTIWIYLWHMPLVLVTNYLIKDWWLKYPIVFGVSFGIFFIQYILVKKTNNKLLNKYLLG